MEARPKYREFLKEWTASRKITSFFGSDKPEFLADWNNVKTAGKKLNLKLPSKSETEPITKVEMKPLIEPKKITKTYPDKPIYYGRISYTPEYEKIQKKDYVVNGKEITTNKLASLLKDENPNDYKEDANATIVFGAEDGFALYYISNLDLWRKLEKMVLNDQLGDVSKFGTYEATPIYKAIEFKDGSISAETYAGKNIYAGGKGKKYYSSGEIGSDMKNAIDYEITSIYPRKEYGAKWYYIFMPNNNDENEKKDKFETISSIHDLSSREQEDVNKPWKKGKDIKIYSFE
jgi:hypothetical protein